MLIRYFILYLLTFIAFPVFADSVWMKNGDILSGSVILIDSNKLIIETKYAGNVTIKIADIKTFKIDKPSIVKNDLYAEKLYIAKIEPSPENGAILIHDKQGNEQTVIIDNNLILMKEKENSIISEYSFSGYIKGGFFYDKGTKKNEKYDLDTELTVKYDLWRNTLGTNLRRSLKNESVSTYYYNIQNTVDKFITPQFFWQGNAQYRYDWIEDIKSKKSFGTGPGYQLWDDQLGSFSLALLVNYQEMHYRYGENSRHPLGSMRWDYQRNLNGKTIRLFTNGSIGRAFNDTVSLDFTATAGVYYKVTDWFILSSSFSKEKDKTKDGDSKNVSYNLGFGIMW